MKKYTHIITEIDEQDPRAYDVKRIIGRKCRPIEVEPHFRLRGFVGGTIRWFNPALGNHTTSYFCAVKLEEIK